ncbi:MAG: site-2 protease family protein [Candidatus Bathyarchaeota archaeon]|nr:site-2 protease family protein [Candidatus Bathyarchaeota archaeon]
MADQSTDARGDMDQRYVEAVERHFEVTDAYFERTTPTFIVKTRGKGYRQYIMKDAFKALADEIRPIRYMPRIRWIVDNYHLSILERNPEFKEDYSRNIILFAATVVTVFIDGYIRSNNPVLREVLMKDTPVFLNALLFTFAIVTIFGLHELGHYAITKYRGVDASMPYFIPAPPGMGGTLGAVITQREPPVNRDALFDLGLSGPITGFLVTTVMGVIGMSLSFVVPQNLVTQWMIRFPEIRFQQLPMPKLLEIIADVIKPTQEGMVLVMHPVAFAAWVGCILTFINLIPSWQLDGGHLIRALVGRESHKIISVAGVLLLVISGYMIMGVVVAFFLMREGMESIEPLDDLSSLSLSRKLGFLIYFSIMALTLVALVPI